MRHHQVFEMKGPASTPIQLRPGPRDPERTRERILAAALGEFSTKGFAGARVAVIARRARINKRMLYHSFGDKAGLFREVLRRKMTQRAAWAASAPDDPAQSLPYWFERALQDPEWIRLQQWEALQGGAGKVMDEEARREAAAAGVENIRSRQQRGFSDAQLDPRNVLLAMVSLSTYAQAFPQVARLITGLSPQDPRFRIERANFLQQIGAALRPSNGAERRFSTEPTGPGESQVA